MSTKSFVASLVKKSSKMAPWLAARILQRDSFLRQMGWFRSFHSGTAVDAEGGPLPWYTYGSIRFIEERISPAMTVFEYGSGHSTLWWSQRSASVDGCEHDPGWYALMRDKFPDNVDCSLVELDDRGSYAEAIHRKGRRFDVVVIDGRNRVQCAKRALEALSEMGVVVWDNSDRPEYDEGYEALKSAGFRRIDFWGMGPINTYGWCTSVFYRPGNCFGI